MDEEEIAQKLDLIEEQVQDGIYDDFEEKVTEIEEQVMELKRRAFEPAEIKIIDKLIKRVNDLKKEGYFYDEEAELDRMFPERHEPDFDQDSMLFKDE